MNVLQLTPELNAGGVEGTTLEVAEALIRGGHNAHVVSAGGRMEGELMAMGAILHRLDIGSKNILTYASRVRALKKIIQTEAINIVHARSRAPAWPGRAAARQMNIPFLATYHGIYNAKSAVDMKLFDPANIKSDDIIQTRKIWGLTPADRAILLPGRLTAWKGQPIAINALASLPDHIKLVIMGDAQGRDSYVQMLKALATSHKLTNRVIFAPHDQNMPLMLAASDIVLSTSIEPEAFGRVAIEAQAMGRPIIATAHGGTLETVLPEQTGLWVPPGDAQALSAAIKRLLNGTHFDTHFTRMRIAQNFSKQQLQEKTLAVYQRLVEK